MAPRMASRLPDNPLWLPRLRYHGRPTGGPGQDKVQDMKTSSPKSCRTRRRLVLSPYAHVCTTVVQYIRILVVISTYMPSRVALARLDDLISPPSLPTPLALPFQSALSFGSTLLHTLSLLSSRRLLFAPGFAPCPSFKDKSSSSLLSLFLCVLAELETPSSRLHPKSSVFATLSTSRRRLRHRASRRQDSSSCH